jgi:hypothetical protein
MRNLRVILIVLIALSVLLLFACGSQSDSGNSSSAPFEDVLTLELTFGDEGLPDEFLLAQPRNLVVDDESNILVFDESRIKMFDANGKPVKIIGSPGQGPGEFGNFAIEMFISPSGFITVQERTEFNLFTPEKEFVEKRRFNSWKYTEELKDKYKIDLSRFTGYSSGLLCPNKEEIILFVNDVNRDNFNDKDEYYDYLFLIKNGNLNLLAKYRNTNMVTVKSSGSLGTPILGTFIYALLPEGRIVYTHTSLENEYKNDKGYLTFKVINMEASHLNSFVYEYEPVIIEDSYIKNYQGGADNPKANKMRKRLREKKFEARITHFKSDGDYIFLLTYRKMDENSSIYEIETLNTVTGKHVSSFQTDTDIPFIKDGYYYLLKYGSDDSFPVIEKYKINPVVYGR